jgi:hypothetical protein
LVTRVRSSDLVEFKFFGEGGGTPIEFFEQGSGARAV